MTAPTRLTVEPDADPLKWPASAVTLANVLARGNTALAADETAKIIVHAEALASAHLTRNAFRERLAATGLRCTYAVDHAAGLVTYQLEQP